MRGVIGVALGASLAWSGLVACSAPPLQPESPPAVSPIQLSEDAPRRAERVFVVADASGTMYDRGTFPRAKALALAFVDALPERDEPAVSPAYDVGSIGFGGHERVSLALSSFDREALRASLDEIEPMGEVDGSGGTTPLHHVVREMAVQLETRPGPAAIVLFSDGAVDDPEAALAAVAELVRRRTGPVCIHAVHLGTDAEGAGLMRQLAASSPHCGSLHEAAELLPGRALMRFTAAVMTGA